MKVLVAVDPALVSSGLAVFLDGALTHASSVRSSAGPSADIAARVLVMANLVAERVRQLYPLERAMISVATEWPQVYRGHRAVGDPNDLPAIAAVGASVAAFLRASEVRSYTPHVWAGQVPKVTRGDCKSSPRALRIRSRLSGLESAVWDALGPHEHDAVDAVGIGCHALGRVRPAP